MKIVKQFFWVICAGAVAILFFGIGAMAAEKGMYVIDNFPNVSVNEFHDGCFSFTVLGLFIWHLFYFACEGFRYILRFIKSVIPS